MITRRHFLSTTASLALGSTLCSRVKADPPTSGNRLIYGYPAGAGGSKLASGLLALLITQGGPFYHLQNLEGRSTRRASGIAGHAAPDGSTILHAISASLTLLPCVYKDVGFDPIRDFKPLASFGDFPYLMVVGPVVPKSVTDVQQYLAWVEKNPEFRNIGISIYGSVGHLAVLTLALTTGAPIRPQPYQGTAAMLSDLRGQTLAAAFVIPNSGASAEISSEVRVIGVTSAQRVSYWPQVRSLAEQGITGMNLSAWFGWFTQAAVPEERLAPLRQAIQRMQASIAYGDLQKSLQLTPNTLTPQQITARMHQEISRYQALVTALNISKFD